MASVKTILVVDDSIVSRAALVEILNDEYRVLEASDGQEALHLLEEHSAEFSAVMLDLVMPVIDGYDILKLLKNDIRYTNLPVVVITGDGSKANEKKALALGAWDFVSKPYDAEIVMFRLKNAIERSQLPALKQLKYLSEYDALTGIYNKSKFFDATRKMLDLNPNERFAFLRFDVDRFQLINSFFGTAEGDKLLIYISEHMAEDALKCTKSSYGRIESDIVGLCIPYDEDKVIGMVRQSKKTLAKFNLNYDIVPSIGIYIIDDPSISVEEMYNRATLAAKTCKGNYVEFYAFYNESMSAAIAAEQEITNEMNFALENEQFEVYLQPQYNIHTNLPCGAEALVRWIHPKKGIISPGEFIPVFERNGFITKLDHYVWEQACKCLHNWKIQGIKPYPISINISRVNVYNPNLVESLLLLVNIYQIEPQLLHLELTESAYTDNPAAMKKVMTQLQKYGFTIMMDDFGSGYSSLALLKDIVIDILKIDMLFLSKTDIPGRGENIIASVIRMAKWLNIPVIAEGAETAEQVDFLRSVGCDYVQGYYFARPMPIPDYEKLCKNLYSGGKMLTDKKRDNYHYDDLFAFNAEIKSLFGNALQAAAIYEFSDNRVEIIRVNEAYYALLGHSDMLANAPEVMSLVGEEYRNLLLSAFYNCAITKSTAECEYIRSRVGAESIWLHTKLSYASTAGNKHIIIGELTDITLHKEVDNELQRYREAWLEGSHNTRTVLIVDDSEINRSILKKILQNKFLFLEAENGAEAIKILQENEEHVDLILLDINMPVMDGKEFLRYKKKFTELDSIPVIMVTGDDSTELQSSTFSLGANDYIVKPFIPTVVTRRVSNVLEANHRFKEMVREYNEMSAQIKTDIMTGLVNRVSAQKIILQRLEHTGGTCAMIIFDIDNFKKINDTYGHNYGDKVICAVADKLRQHFNNRDVIVRMGGDEFAVFISNIKNIGDVEKKAHQLCKSLRDINIDGNNADISCSIGISVSDKHTHSFDLLYNNAGKALYNSRCRGRNIVSVYGEESVATSITKWMNDAESVLDVVKDIIYVCEKDTYEFIYANNSLCELMGVDRYECRGKKCYEVLMHRTKPCEFCSMSKMEEGKMYTRLFRMPNGAQVFLMHGRNIKRNGINIHLEVAVDVTDIESKSLIWSEVKGYNDKSGAEDDVIVPNY
ncbi:MAG: EAL domain-containing protein [Hydrogenoanaerobacterium sp.]